MECLGLTLQDSSYVLIHFYKMQVSAQSRECLISALETLHLKNNPPPKKNPTSAVFLISRLEHLFKFIVVFKQEGIWIWDGIAPPGGFCADLLSPLPFLQLVMISPWLSLVCSACTEINVENLCSLSHKKWELFT